MKKDEGITNIILLVSSLLGIYASMQMEKRKAKAIKFLIYMVAGLYFLIVVGLILIFTMGYAHGT